MSARQLPDLTVAWFQGAMTPRHQPDGSILHTLTPPRRGSRLPAPIILLGVAILSALAFIYGIR